MAFKDTVETMKNLLAEIGTDLPKAEEGNKAASQRVRVNTIELEKIAKQYRKESIAAEKKGAKPKASKKAAPKKAPAKPVKKKK